jgi:hypothetical protein
MTLSNKSEKAEETTAEAEAKADERKTEHQDQALQGAIVAGVKPDKEVPKEKALDLVKSPKDMTRPLNIEEYGRHTIYDILALTQEELAEYLMLLIDGLIEVPGGLLYCPPMPEGVSYRPMLTAHLDTVDRTPVVETTISNGVMSLAATAKNRCLGADDRAGVYAILQILLKLRAEHAKYSYAFFYDEERGCVGSRKFTASKEYTEMLKTTSCFVSIDRKCEPNHPEIATYDCDDKLLTEHLLKHFTGYKTVRGSITDCAILSRGSGELYIPCFNLSAGYKGEHTPKETLHLPTLFRIIRDVCNYAPENKQYTYPKPKYQSYYSGGFNRRSAAHNAFYGDDYFRNYGYYDGWGRDYTEVPPTNKANKNKKNKSRRSGWPSDSKGKAGRSGSDASIPPIEKEYFVGDESVMDFDEVFEPIACSKCGDDGAVYTNYFTGEILCEACGLTLLHNGRIYD